VPRLIETPTTIVAAGTPPKQIREYVGRVNSGDGEVSIARMSSPPGRSEPGQRPEFEEYSIALSGMLVIEHEAGTLEVAAAVAAPGEWVRYSTPTGVEYVAVRTPAFSPETVHRDE
jgi:hypothetical protein